MTLLMTPSLALPQDATAKSPQATFRSSVDLVQVRAVVRDRRGRFVGGLERKDFEVLDGGQYRPLVDLQFDTNAPLRVAMLFDVSGSMSVSSKLDDAARAARQILSGLQPGDEAAVFAFDTGLRELQPFTSDLAAIERAFSGLRAYGQTSIYDAVAETASRITADRSRRQAIVIVTDGVDTRSRMTAEEVSAIASAIDVPIYVFAVVAPVDHAGASDALRELTARDIDTPLGRLAYWTGGSTHITSTPAHASLAAREILGELRHQYLLAFEPGPSGWRPLVVRATDRDYSVRARTGYRSGHS
ncbi:MAG: VWA domain-containing protein [Acidobacteriota bacterium]|nr:VWA domain-containing protein [Acidobacteriota bacterium]